MLSDALRTHCGYDRFANEQILDTAAGLPPEQWLEPGTAGHGSVRDTLIHVMTAHRGWLAICDGSRTAEDVFADQLDPADYPDVAAVRALWRGIDDRTQAFLGRLEGAGAAGHRGSRLHWAGASLIRRSTG